MKRLTILIGVAVVCAVGQVRGAQDETGAINVPAIIHRGIPFEVKIPPQTIAGNFVEIAGGDTHHRLSRDDSTSEIRQPVTISTLGHHTIELRSQTGTFSKKEVTVIPGILSLLPPLFAITLAFLARQVLVSLFCGIWLGATIIHSYNPIDGFTSTLDHFILNAMADPDNAAILLFTLALGGMVGVISKSGGTQGIVERLSKYAKSARSGQLATWAMGLLIFFDDYANTLIVGNSMRPFTDKLRISREKLAYIVDSTAAPVVSVALISTWVGFQVGMIDNAMSDIDNTANAYTLFLQSIPFSTYSILAILMVLLVSVTARDFGPMRFAEERASLQGKLFSDGAQPVIDTEGLELAPDAGTPKRWFNALIPILVVIFTTLLGLYLDGRAALADSISRPSLGKIFGEANSFRVLTWAAFTGLFVAGLLGISQRLLTLRQMIAATIDGFKSMLLAGMILVLAWGIGDICEELRTADFVIHSTGSFLSPHLMPLITFLIASFISFSTGTSWATMAILTPIVVPVAARFGAEMPLDAGQTLVATIGAVLSGSVLGDHCSPISDTTILSSMASAADHMDHVRTQMPYALTTGGVAMVTGYLPAGWGLNPYISLLLGVGLLVAVVLIWGRKT
jgi:Na+/H+ antiporter NhaC